MNTQTPDCRTCQNFSHLKGLCTSTAVCVRWHLYAQKMPAPSKTLSFARIVELAKQQGVFVSADCETHTLKLSGPLDLSPAPNASKDTKL